VKLKLATSDAPPIESHVAKICTKISPQKYPEFALSLYMNWFKTAFGSGLFITENTVNSPFVFFGEVNT
jgi:hypothetical protein